MSISYNKVIFAGFLGADPEIRSLGQSGGEVVQLSVAATERWGSGRDQERTEWGRVVCFDEKQIEFADKYLRKGDPVLVEGRLQTRKWEDRDGNDKYTTEIVAFSIKSLSQGGGDGGRGSDRGDRGDRDGGRGRDRDGGRDRDRGGDRDGGSRREASGRGGDRGGRGDDRGRGRDDDRSGGRDRDRGGRDSGTRGGGGGSYGDQSRGGDLDDEIPFSDSNETYIGARMRKQVI